MKVYQKEYPAMIKNPTYDRLNEISAILNRRMMECGRITSGAIGGAPIAFATVEEMKELHELRLKLQEIEAIHASGAKERIAERIGNRKKRSRTP